MRCDIPTRSSAACTRFRRSSARHAAVGERQLDVLVDREVADQVERLEDEADLPVADAGALRRGEPRHRLRRRACSCPPSASRAGRGSRAASSCRSPTGRRSRRTRPCRISRWMSDRACVSTSSVKNTFLIPSSAISDSLMGRPLVDLRDSCVLGRARDPARTARAKLRSLAAQSSFHPHPLHAVPPGHVGDDHLVARLQTAEHLDRVHRGPAQPHRACAGRPCRPGSA